MNIYNDFFSSFFAATAAAAATATVAFCVFCLCCMMGPLCDPVLAIQLLNVVVSIGFSSISQQQQKRLT